MDITIITPDYDKDAIQKLDDWIFTCQINMNAPQASGYEQEWYKKEYDKAKAKRDSWGYQLEFDFS